MLPEYPAVEEITPLGSASESPMDVDLDTGTTDATDAPAGSQDLDMVIGKLGDFVYFLYRTISCQITQFRVNRTLFPVPWT